MAKSLVYNINERIHKATPVVVDPGNLTPIDVEFYRFDGNSGTVRVSAGFPMKPGAITASTLDRFRVLDANGIEQRIAVTALRGKHPDGSLRSVGVQFDYNLTDRTPVAGTVLIDPNGRSTTDISWTEPTYASSANRAVLMPTSPRYLCDSYVSLCPLQPETDDSSEVNQYFGTAANRELGVWADTLEDPSYPNSDIGWSVAQTTYEHVHSLQCAWIRAAGTARGRLFYERWFERFYNQMKGTVTNGGANYFLPGSNNPSYNKITAVDPSIAVGVPPNNAGSGGLAEWHSGIYHGWTSAYLLTAWKQPWRLIALGMNSTMGYASTYTGAQGQWVPAGGNASLRVGATKNVFPCLCAYIVEATMQVPGGFGGGRNPSRSWVTELPWVVDVWEDFQYQTGTYTDGLVGQRPTSSINCLHSPGVAGHFPNFQLYVWSRVAIFYYENVFPDSRIPTYLQTAADFLINQFWLGSDGFYRINYEHVPNPPTTGLGGNPYSAPFFQQLFGWVYAYTGNTLYKTWCERAMSRQAVGQVTKAWKAYGEYFGGSHQSGGYYYDGGAVRGIAGAHPTVITEPPHHAS